MSDDAILDYIFNPGLQGAPLESSEPSPTEEQPRGPTIAPSLLSQLRSLESRAILAAESRQLDSALSLLTECISLCPHYASAYNNRAQVHQLRGDLDLAMRDCTSAIEHAAHQGDRSVLRQSYTQRGIIRRVKGNDEEAALKDLQMGGKYGNVYAKREAVRLNPYAALCNQYLAQAMQHQWSGVGSGDAAPAATGPTSAQDGSKTGSSDSSSCVAKKQ